MTIESEQFLQHLLSKKRREDFNDADLHATGIVIGGKSIHEIAAMSMKQAREYIRQYRLSSFGKGWGRFSESGPEEKKEFICRIKYEVRNTEHKTVTVDAYDEDEAYEKAKNLFNDDCDCDEELVDIDIEEKEQKLAK